MNGWYVVCIILVLAPLYIQVSARMADRHSSRDVQGCTKCPPGRGVAEPCSRLVDTECEPCIKGSNYSAHHSHHSRCWPCSRCGVGLYEAHPCTPTRDTVCDDCTRFISPHHQHLHPMCSYLFLPRLQSRHRHADNTLVL